MEYTTYPSDISDVQVNREKRRYNKAWFGKRVHNIYPTSKDKKFRPMMSWKPRPIKGSKRWFVAHNKRLSPFGLSHSNTNGRVDRYNKRLSPFGLSHSNNNVRVDTLETLKTTSPVLMKRKKAPRRFGRSSLGYAR